MSMISYVLGITPAQIETMRAKPEQASLVARVAQHDDSLRSREEMMKSMPQEQRERFEALKVDPIMRDYNAKITEAREQIMAIGPLEPAFCLEKTWHMLHYLFTGHSGSARAPGDL